MSKAGPKFFGKYRGQVVSNHDPNKLGRIQATVADVFGKEPSGWALPCFAMAGPQTGLWAIPPVGAAVWIEFEAGDPEYPIWTGCFYASPAQVPMNEPMMVDKKILLRTPGGTQLLLDDSPGKPAVSANTAAGDQLQMGPQGVAIKTAAGHKLVLGADGITIEAASGAKLVLGAAGIEINNGTGAIVKLSGPKVDINHGALAVA